MPADSSSSTAAPYSKAGRGMRKGTKSCLECRKRKVKCVFSDNDYNVCVTCKARGSKCTEQRKLTDAKSAAAAHKVTLEERVAQLEALIRAAGPHPGDGLASPESSPGNPNHEEQPTPNPNSLQTLGSPESYNGSEESRATAHHATDPVVAVFDNAIWRQNSDGPVHSIRTNTSAGTPIIDNNLMSKCARTCAALLKDFPPPRVLADILNATSAWWKSWRTGGSWLSEMKLKHNINTLQDFMSWSLYSGDPPITGLGILALAISIQQLDPQYHQHILQQLAYLPGELFQEYYDRVERLIINDIDFSTSRAGIEVITMAGKIFMNLGLIKRTWVFLHKAISHAQLLGLHRPVRASPKETDAEMESRLSTWFNLCERDTYTSLLLGLPYAADGRTILPQFQGEKGTLKFFQYRLVRLAVQIIDRNQMGMGCSIAMTQDIQAQAEISTSELDPEFWDAPTALHQGRISRPEYMERLAAQFFYFQMTVLLHQPLMIESIEDHRLEGNREQCLQACRNVLRIYHLMRSDSGKAFSMVKLIDYQAFICSAMLLLGLLGYGNPSSVSQTMHQDRDWDTVQSTLDVLRQAAATTNNSIATQAVQGLETLSALVRAGKTGMCAMTPEQCQNPYAKIVVPGSGTITILPGTFLKKSIRQPSQEPPTIHPPPIFHLSHGLFQSLPNGPPPGGVPAMNPASGIPASEELANQINIAATDFEIPYMDFDWTNMIDMNTEDDWAWLANLSGNGSGLMV
ncbi:hypothetical protein BP6252_09015 [Coleophoma cylindrospora]|uniref:Zn(2)-C6 fungal-type domain-containing protein n=1 Tax=Coleophoma cylindrospora TaxID=1849047 RepID=A0A3D8R0Q7_9HELO|nr:hypothetical protein BP6252_09015 [Coleophoma cylindrospora]